jgi:hypothetical protein
MLFRFSFLPCRRLSLKCPSRAFQGPARGSLPPAERTRLLAKVDAAAAIIEKADLLSKLDIEVLKALLD